MDQVRPQDGQWQSDHAYLDWPAYPLSDTHQVAAMRRPRTEARAGDWMTQEGLTNRGPLQKPIIARQRGISDEHHHVVGRRVHWRLLRG